MQSRTVQVCTGLIQLPGLRNLLFHLGDQRGQVGLCRPQVLLRTLHGQQLRIRLLQCHARGTQRVDQPALLPGRLVQQSACGVQRLLGLRQFVLGNVRVVAHGFQQRRIHARDGIAEDLPRIRNAVVQADAGLAELFHQLGCVHQLLPQLGKARGLPVQVVVCLPTGGHNLDQQVALLRLSCHQPRAQPLVHAVRLVQCRAAVLQRLGQVAGALFAELSARDGQLFVALADGFVGAVQLLIRQLAQHLGGLLVQVVDVARVDLAGCLQLLRVRLLPIAAGPHNRTGARADHSDGTGAHPHLRRGGGLAR